MSTTSIHQLVLCLMVLAFPMLVNTDELQYSEEGVVAIEEDKMFAESVKTTKVNKATVGFNKDQKADIQKRHNNLRTRPKASNMLEMGWDSELEKLAQSYANKCMFKHNGARKAKAFTSVGENLYINTARTFEPAAAVQAWYDEVKDYNYATNKCKKDAVCGHYTQVVWDDSFAVGCGVKYCDRLRGAEQFKIFKGFIVVCNYGPSGNFEDQKPYKTGKPCSACPKNRKYCVQGLCSTSP